MLLTREARDIQFKYLLPKESIDSNSKKIEFNEDIYFASSSRFMVYSVFVQQTRDRPRRFDGTFIGNTGLKRAKERVKEIYRELFTRYPGMYIEIIRGDSSIRWSTHSHDIFVKQKLSDGYS